jgi:uncharacterized protein YifE (UPF0438 family)
MDIGGNMDNKKCIKITEWMAKATQPDSKVSASDQMAICFAVMKAVEEVEPIYNKYNKKRKPKKKTANLSGEEFAEKVFWEMMKFSDL